MTRTQNPYKVNDIVTFDFGYKVAAGRIVRVTSTQVVVNTYQGDFAVDANSPKLRKATR